MAETKTKPAATTAVATAPPSSSQIAPEKLNELARQCQDAIAQGSREIGTALVVAVAIQELRKAVVPLVPRIRPLMGTNLGFRTDRDTGDKSYSDAQVADVLVEAVGRGLRWTGNEFNIISGRCYITKEGYTRLVSELPDLTDLELTPSVPRTQAGGAVIKYLATWRINGTKYNMTREIPVRLNAGMGADAAIGKATRKMLASIHARVTGSALSYSDSEGEEVVAITVEERPAPQAAPSPATPPPAQTPAADPVLNETAFDALFHGKKDITWEECIQKLNDAQGTAWDAATPWEEMTEPARAKLVEIVSEYPDATAGA
jgi:hypothetical protein